MDWAATFAILVPALSGLTFLAYKHPNAYQRLYFKLMKWVFVGSVAVWIWNISSCTTRLAMLPYVATANHAKATNAAETVQVGVSDWRVAVMAIATVLYVIALNDLHRLIGPKE